MGKAWNWLVQHTAVNCCVFPYNNRSEAAVWLESLSPLIQWWYQLFEFSRWWRQISDSRRVWSLCAKIRTRSGEIWVRTVIKISKEMQREKWLALKFLKVVIWSIIYVRYDVGGLDTLSNDLSRRDNHSNRTAVIIREYAVVYCSVLEQSILRLSH